MPDTAPLAGLTPDTFLRDYWQKRPLLIEDAFPDFVPPVTPEELAGLACEPDVESRLVLEQGGDYPWQLRHGPFEEDDFLALPETHWSLLVQEVDRLLPAVEALRDRFRFVPDWRVDDVMISFAPAQGGVGAHIDNYDVFLLQGLGRRRWRIGDAPVEDETILPDLDVRVLAGFEPAREYVLQPGDMLYLPPRYAHEGVALDDCMTLSIGFRAPSHEEILTGLVEHALARTDPQARYADPGLRPPLHPGEIGPDALDQVRRVVRKALTGEALTEWFGTHVTAPRRAEGPLPPEASYPRSAVRAMLEAGPPLAPAPGARLAFVCRADGAATLFAAGEVFPLAPELAYAAPLLTDRRPVPAEALRAHADDAAFVALVAGLLNQGVLAPVQES